MAGEQFDTRPDALPPVIRKLLRQTVVKNLIGAEEWDLTEDEELELWALIDDEEKS